MTDNYAGLSVHVSGACARPATPGAVFAHRTHATLALFCALHWFWRSQRAIAEIRGIHALASRGIGSPVDAERVADLGDQLDSLDEATSFWTREAIYAWPCECVHVCPWHGVSASLAAVDDETGQIVCKVPCECLSQLHDPRCALDCWCFK